MEASEAVSGRMMRTFWLAPSAKSLWLEESSYTVLALPGRGCVHGCQSLACSYAEM